MTCCREVALSITVGEDGQCCLAVESTLNQPEAAQSHSSILSKQNTNETSSLVQDILTARYPTVLVQMLKQAWTPTENPDDTGTFANLDDDESLLHTIPLYQKLLSCMTWPSIDRQASFACADLLSRMCLGAASSLLLQPNKVLKMVKRLTASKTPETREGTLRYVAALIKGNQEYRQCFLESNAIDSILDQIDYENEVEVATYACKSVLSLVHLVKDEVDRLEKFLRRVLPVLIRMLEAESEISTKLNALQCLSDMRDIDIVALKLQENSVVALLAPLLRTGDIEIKRIALDLLGKGVNMENTEKIRDLPVEIAYSLLQEIFEKSPSELEPVKLRLLESILSAVHREQFLVDTEKTQFFIRMMIHDAKSCASKIIDILVVAWDMHVGMAGDMAQSDQFLAQLPHVMHVTPAALQIMHSMFQADVVASHAMAKNLGIAELQSLRKEMNAGTDEVKMVVLDIFMKLVDQEGQTDDVLASGLLEDLVIWFDSESISVKKRSWRLCARILELRPQEATPLCIEQGLVQKYEILFSSFLDRLHTSMEPLQNEQGLNDLFIILRGVSELKSGARAICKTSIISHLLNFITPTGIISQELRDMVMNVLTALPVTTSRKLAQQCGFDVITELVKDRDVQLKRLGFEILKNMSFKKCTSYLADSALIPQLCRFLPGNNIRLKTDSVSVLCRMARFSFDVVSRKIAEEGCATILWNASRGLDNDDDNRILRKIFRTLKSIEASANAEKKRLSRSLSRRSSVCSFSSETNIECGGFSRSSSFSMANRPPKTIVNFSSVRSRPPRSTRMVSCGPGLGLKNGENTDVPFNSFSGFGSVKQASQS